MFNGLFDEARRYMVQEDLGRVFDDIFNVKLL